MSFVPNKIQSLRADLRDRGSSPKYSLRQPAGNPQKGTK